MLITTTLIAAAVLVICVLVHRAVSINPVNVGGVIMDVGGFTASGCVVHIVERNREKFLLITEKQPRWSVAIYDSTGKRVYLYNENNIRTV